MYLDWKSRPEDYYAIDIETDDLNATLIHVLCWENLKTKETGECIGHKQIEEFFERTRGSIYVGHNALKFDIPVCNRLVNARVPVNKVVDTLVLSTLYNPSLEGGHSLDAWGQRLKEPKQDFHDFSVFTPKMLEYCHQDVKICGRLFRGLVNTLRKLEFSEESVYIQHHFTAILARQQRNGFKFDGQRALVLFQKLEKIKEDLEGRVHEVFPPTLRHVATRKVNKKDGTPTAMYLKDKERYTIKEGDEPNTYLAFEQDEFNLGSYNQRTQRLLDLGWKNLPHEVTKGGNPKPFDKGDIVPSLKEFLEKNDVPEVELIAEWMAFNGRAIMLNTWLDNWNEETECIHGSIFVANTLRLRHQAPNTANIPAVRIDKEGNPILGRKGHFTYEARDLWVAREGRVLVGTDAAGLELRMLAHFINNPVFTKQVIDGDPHQYNADLVGVDRPTAKTLLYAIMYGAGVRKIASTLGCKVEEASEIRNRFLTRLGIEGVMNEAARESERGRIRLVDGSQVVCPSSHAALNYRLQGSGARVMAKAAIILESKIRNNRLDSLKVGDIHDEWQYDVDPDHARLHARYSVEAIQEAGVVLGLNVPLDGEAKIGRTWAETH